VASIATSSVTTVSTDNIAAAGEAADQMAKLIGDSGKVAVIVHDQTSQTGTTRRDGFANRMKDKHPNITVVAIEYGAGDPVKSADLAKAIMTANPDLKGFFGANEGSAKGVLNALKETGKEGKIVAIGYDSGQQQIDAIKSGVMAGAITQNPVGIGAKCVDAALDAIAGQDRREDHRHRLFLVRQDQHRQARDRGGPLQVTGRHPSRPVPGGCPHRGQPPVVIGPVDRGVTGPCAVGARYQFEAGQRPVHRSSRVRRRNARPANTGAARCLRPACSIPGSWRRSVKPATAPRC